MIHNQLKILIAVGVLAVAGLATAAFMHRTSSSDAAYAPQFAQPANMGMTSAPPAQYAAPQPQYAQSEYAVSSMPPAQYASDGYYSTANRPVYVRQATSAPAPVYIQSTDSQNTEYVEGREYSTGPHGERVYRPVHRGRSKAHSVEIVAGTAAVGAVIGGLAGGGKGAAIGAASGGGAGFAYDRLTHNH